MRNKSLLLATAALTAVLSLSGCSKSDTAQKASVAGANVKLTPAQRQNIHLYTVASSPFHKVVETSGAVDYDNDQATSVLAPISGPVSRLLVEPGDKVKAGAALAAVVSPDFADAVSAYRKALVTAQNTRRIADFDKDLAQHEGVAQREAEQAETDAVSAEADRDAALEEVQSLNVDPDIVKAIQAGKPTPRIEGMIRAPIGGTVVERLITPGELLQAGSTASFTVADLSKVWVMAQVFGADLASVHVGDTAQVETGIAGKILAGSVDNIAALVDPDTHSVSVRVVVDNPDGLLKKQMYVRVRLQAREDSTGLLIPVSAVLRDDENFPFVYVAQADGSFARQHVTLGYRANDQYEITDGLKAGAQVVIDGALFLQFMQDQ